MPQFGDNCAAVWLNLGTTEQEVASFDSVFTLNVYFFFSRYKSETWSTPAAITLAADVLSVDVLSR